MRCKEIPYSNKAPETHSNESKDYYYNYLILYRRSYLVQNRVFNGFKSFKLSKTANDSFHCQKVTNLRLPNVLFHTGSYPN